MIRHDFPTGTWLTGDTFEGMATLPDQSVDMILADLPYGTTQNKWDSVLPLDRLWAEYWRICRGAVVLTATQPFTSALVCSQLSAFKYDWSWSKTAVTGHLNARRRPMRNHEDILVFGDHTYRPQGLKPYGRGTSRGHNGTNFGKSGTVNFQENTGFPRSRLDVGSVESDRFHPTQKPVALFDYLIRTYTDQDATVLDNTAGSGTTAVAAIRSGRRWVCIERDETYSNAALMRICSEY